MTKSDFGVLSLVYQWYTVPSSASSSSAAAAARNYKKRVTIRRIKTQQHEWRHLLHPFPGPATHTHLGYLVIATKIIITMITTIIITTRPKPAFGRHGLAGSSGGDHSKRINSSHSIIQEFARLDWMGLSGGDKTCQNNFPTHQNNFQKKIMKNVTHTQTYTSSY